MKGYTDGERESRGDSHGSTVLAGIGKVVTWPREQPLSLSLEWISTQCNSEGRGQTATRITWEQAALGGSAVFVFKL